MQARTEQFHRDAQERPRARRGIARLRRFLHTNQNHRFTNGEASQLFQAVQLYVAAARAPPPPAAAAAAAAAAGAREPAGNELVGEDEEGGEDPVVGLVEDALKMPFTVFGTAQKSTMLKWLHQLTPGAGAPAPDDDAGPPAPSRQWWAVIDLDGDAGLEAMDAAGDTVAVARGSCATPGVWEQLVEAWEAGGDVSVQLAAAPGGGLQVLDVLAPGQPAA